MNLNFQKRIHKLYHISVKAIYETLHLVFVRIVDLKTQQKYYFHAILKNYSYIPAQTQMSIESTTELKAAHI